MQPSPVLLKKIRLMLHLTPTRIHNIWGLVFLMPALILLCIFKIYPMLLAFRYSFFDYDLLTPEKFSGLSNYLSLLGDDLFKQSLGASLYYVVGSVVPIWVLSLLLALAFNRSMPFKNVLRSIYFMPVVMPAVIVAVLWQFLYQPYGVLNAILNLFSIPPINWISSVKMAMPSLIIIGIWRGVPYFMIIFLAGLEAIPREYYEAAMMDGANSWKSFRYITMPLLKPTMMLVMIMSVTVGIMVFVNPIIVTNFGGPAGATRVLPLYIFQTGFEFYKMGLASAASVILFAIVMVFTLIRFSTSGEE
jgi:multiple sugar transport system permease protein